MGSFPKQQRQPATASTQRDLCRWRIGVRSAQTRGQALVERSLSGSKVCKRGAVVALSYEIRAEHVKLSWSAEPSVRGGSICSEGGGAGTPRAGRPQDLIWVWIL